jgi:hypothetical protein
MVRLLSRTWSLCLLCLLSSFIPSAHARRVTPAPSSAESSGPGYRFDRGGWKFVHLEGTPGQIGFQHGQLLSTEIADLVNVMKVETRHDTKRDWNFYREASRKMLWPHIDTEYQQELEGIAKGVQSKGMKLDVWDIVALKYGTTNNSREKSINRRSPQESAP